MSNLSKKSKFQSALAHSKAVRGIERREHFASGGTVTAWRGKHQVQRDRKKEAARTACRQQRGE